MRLIRAALSSIARLLILMVEVPIFPHPTAAADRLFAQGIHAFLQREAGLE